MQPKKNVQHINVNIGTVFIDRYFDMSSRLLIILFLLASFSYGRPSDHDKKRIDKYVIDIDKKLNDKKLILKKYPDRSIYGGSVTGHYFNNKLVLITADDNVANSSHHMAFYIMADTLVFVKEIKRQIKESEYIKNDTDKTDDADRSKLPLEVDDNNFYYVSDNNITSFQLKSFNKKINATEHIISEKKEMIITHYKSHLEELNGIK